MGSVTEDGEQDNAGMRTSIEFRPRLAKMINLLIIKFTDNGSTDIEQFRNPA